MAEIEAEVVQPMAEVEHLLSLVGNMTALTTLEDEASGLVFFFHFFGALASGEVKESWVLQGENNGK